MGHRSFQLGGFLGLNAWKRNRASADNSGQYKSRRLHLERLEDRRLLAVSNIAILAAGATGEESFQLKIDGTAVATFNNVGGDAVAREFQTFSYTHPTEVTADQVRLTFINNGTTSSGADRNLRIDGFRLDGKKFESEASTVLSTGTYQSSDGCAPGHKRSEWLQCNGSFSFGVTTTEIKIRAAGATHEEDIDLQIDGTTVATFTDLGGDYSAGQYQTYIYTTTDPVSVDQVRVAFINDGNTAGGADRNVRIDRITLDGELYESEASNVLSTGTYRPSDGIAPGYKNSEFLHANGYFQYGNSGSVIDVLAAANTGEEDLALQIDGTTVATFSQLGGNYSTGIYQSHTYTHTRSVSANQIRVVFLNDGTAAGGGDRNVRVDGVDVDGTFHEANALSTLSTGTYIAGVGVKPGHWESQFLHANGYFQFEVPFNPGTLALGTTAISVNEQAGTATIPVVRTGGSDSTVAQNFTTIDATATAGNDYTATSGFVVFAPGQTTASIVVPLLNDSLEEGNETFNVAIDQTIGGAIAGQPRTATITILDDDGPPTPGDGNGLLGEYYNDINLTELVFDRTDTTINFNWGGGSPDPQIGADTFSVAWVGEIEPLFSETYTFQVGIDDGLRLWVDNQLIIDQWIDQNTTLTGQVALQGGLRHDIRVEYFENGGQARIAMSWSSASQSLEIVPQTQLYSDPPSNISGTYAGQTLISGLVQPTAIDFAPLPDGRMFIAEKRGIVRVYQNGSLLSQPFIDISAEVNNVQDRGLLGLAVHPNFPTTPYIYLLYTYDPPETAGNSGLAGPDGSGNRVSRLVRYTADAANGYNTVVPGSGVVILGTNSVWANISHPEQDSTNNIGLEPSCTPDGTMTDCLASDSRSHSIGTVVFGTDGNLYVSNGDGTSFDQVDPRTARVQSLDSLSGKILRIDPITGAGLSDNPFYNGNASANRSKVYSYGLRNPFRFAVRPADNEPYIADVGWTTWEEINTGRGANFGWPWYEGGNGQNLQTGGYSGLPEAQAFYASNPNATPPLFSRSHANGGVAIIAGDFYSGTTYPSLVQGSLFYTDFGDPTIRALKLNQDGSLNQILTLTGSVGTVIEMTMGLDNHMYYVDFNGIIGRLIFTPNSSSTSGGSGGNSGGGSGSAAKGDFDIDGDTDGADFLAWQRGFGTTQNVAIADGDSNADGAVDQIDLNAWQSNFSASSLEESSASATSTVSVSQTTGSGEETAFIIVDGVFSSSESNGDEANLQETEATVDVQSRDTLFARLPYAPNHRKVFESPSILEQTTDSERETNHRVSDEVFAGFSADVVLRRLA